MDNFDDIQRAWLNQPARKEDPGPIVTQVLREARNFRTRARRCDLAIIAACVLLLPLGLLSVLIAWFYFGEPLVAAGYAIWGVTLLGGLAAYRIFYHSLREMPSCSTNSREYIEQSIAYLDRRERFIMRSAAPMSAMLALAGIVFAIAVYRGQDGLFQAVTSFIGQPSVWATLAAQRRYEEKRSRLREMLADLASIELQSGELS